ncbi:MAG: putative acyl-CoA dehydrogenase AidB [Acidimicrobiales bacterium]|nr:putative acyl-CoA dehydrogenase AidB [Acidimicrobiales bacterium]
MGFANRFTPVARRKSSFVTGGRVNHTSSATHEVLNQPPPLEGYDVFGADRVLVDALHREGAGWALAELTDLGELAGSAEAIEWGRQANQNPPVLHTHDRFGYRIDEVRYHPAYHQLMSVSVRNGLHAAPWADQRSGAHVARAAKVIVWYQVDAGHVCPISMTYSVVPALRHQPDLAAVWEPRLTGLEYDHRLLPAADKRGVTFGMGLTEKQGGSDVRSNSTSAAPNGGASTGNEYLLTGHKWFCSAPMSDGFLVLAQAPGGLSCFLMPRWTPDGEPNRFHIQQLKDKLGDRSNASAEVELSQAWAQMIGEEGRGVRTIIEMVHHTRLDCILGSASIMRKGTAEAIHHAENREAFGAKLSDKPLMRNVLTDLAIESEAATMAAMRLARAFDAIDDEHEQALKRIATPVIKYWTCKRAPSHAAEALECLGGNGYVEDSGLPRLFRQSPVNGVWEGSGNVICLDVLRAMARSPESLEVFLAEIEDALGEHSVFDSYIEDLRDLLVDLVDVEWRARSIVQRLALAYQASLLLRHAPAPNADAFVRSRLGGSHTSAFGTLPSGIDTAAVIDRHRPEG